MSEPRRQAHWRKVYKDKGEKPATSLELIHGVGAKPNSAIVDLGGGASRLVDVLVSEGYCDLTVLDLSDDAIAITRSRLAERAALVKWIVADVTEWEPSRQYDLWHDRAAFHFLTEATDRAAYLDRLMQAIRPGGHAIIATFAIDGPGRCSGLPVIRYDATLKPITSGIATKKIMMVPCAEEICEGALCNHVPSSSNAPSKPAAGCFLRLGVGRPCVIKKVRGRMAPHALFCGADLRRSDTDLRLLRRRCLFPDAPLARFRH
jgi:2-polyprenyl-3-methyl-5-hydroxy-6-metoxy-1,4-benzoquinol methylase